MDGLVNSWVMIDVVDESYEVKGKSYVMGSNWE